MKNEIKYKNQPTTLQNGKINKKVEWSSDTVENKKLAYHSSKYCSIYEKPQAFGESFSEIEK